MIVIVLCSDQNHKFYTSHSNIQFVIRYVPSLVGTITTLAARSIYYAFSQLDLYIVMADHPSSDGNSGHNKGTVAHPYPELESLKDWYYRLRSWSPGLPRYWLWIITSTNFILVRFVTSFKSTFLLASSSQNPDASANDWTVSVSPTSTLILIFLYTIEVASTISLLIYLRSRCTGLKWVPATIADQLALFHESNVLRDFEVLEKDPGIKSTEILRDREYRIGYWEKGRNRRLVYGVGRVSGGRGTYALSLLEFL
jgi:hypothetical protein